MLDGKSWSPSLDLHVPGLDIDIMINQLNITDVTIGHSSMAFVDNTDTVRTTLSNINVTFALDAKATSLLPVPMEFTKLFVQGLSIQLDLSTTTENELIW